MPQDLGDPGHTTLARVRASRRFFAVDAFTGVQKESFLATNGALVSSWSRHLCSQSRIGGFRGPGGCQQERPDADWWMA